MSERYSPQPVPDTGNPTLERFIAEEFDRIAITAALGFSEQAYGGMGHTPTDTDSFSVGPTPTQIDGYEVKTPGGGEIYTGIDLASGELTIESAGVFYVFARITAEVQDSREYLLQLYVNGSPTGLSAFADVTGGSSYALFSFGNLITLSIGDSLDLRATSTSAASQFDIIISQFGVFRVSEAR